MMHYLFGGLILLSLVFGVMNGRVAEISQAALGEGAAAVALALKLCGSLCLWSGVMKIAQKSGLTECLSRGLSPVLRLLFPRVSPRSQAGRFISMNLVASLIGLGNAVTPLGISAMRELEALNPDKKRATNEMVLFVVLNTASLQIIPTTTAMLRLAAGSAAPMEIVPAVWAASLCSVLSGILAVHLLRPFYSRAK